jgi:hypothetical protein
MTGKSAGFDLRKDGGLGSPAARHGFGNRFERQRWRYPAGSSDQLNVICVLPVELTDTMESARRCPQLPLRALRQRGHSIRIVRQAGDAALENPTLPISYRQGPVGQCAKRATANNKLVAPDVDETFGEIHAVSCVELQA